MAYEKINWVSGETKLSADNFNHMEDGIAAAVPTVEIDLSADELPKLSELPQSAMLIVKGLSPDWIAFSFMRSVDGKDKSAIAVGPDCFYKYSYRFDPSVSNLFEDFNKYSYQRLYKHVLKNPESSVFYMVIVNTEKNAYTLTINDGVYCLNGESVMDVFKDSISFKALMDDEGGIELPVLDMWFDDGNLIVKVNDYEDSFNAYSWGHMLDTVSQL